MTQPKISIVIPSYNKAQYLTATLNSIINQKYPNLEVIIQDPGSTDGSLGIISAFVKKYPKVVKLYHEPDNGQLDAINKGLAKAKGDILTYINADDCYIGKSLNTVSKYFTDHPEALWLAGQGKVVNDGGSEIAKAVTYYKNLLLSFNSYQLLLVTNYLMQPSVFLTKLAWKKFGPFRGISNFVMEYDMWLRLGEYKMPAIILQTLSAFRIPAKSISRDKYAQTLGQDLEIVKKHTTNPVILLFHRLHNIGRVIVIKQL